LPAGAAGAARGIEAALLLVVAQHPPLFERWGEAIATATFVHADLDALRARLLSARLDANGDGFDAADRADVGRMCAALRLEPGLAEPAFLRPEADMAMAEHGLVEMLRRQALPAAVTEAVTEAQQRLSGDAGEDVDARLRAVAGAMHRDGRGLLLDDDADESHLAQALHAAISNEIWVKKRRRPPPNQ
jgi:hypothetical protein